MLQGLVVVKYLDISSTVLLPPVFLLQGRCHLTHQLLILGAVAAVQAAVLELSQESILDLWKYADCC